MQYPPSEGDTAKQRNYKEAHEGSLTRDRKQNAKPLDTQKPRNADEEACKHYGNASKNLQSRLDQQTPTP